MPALKIWNGSEWVTIAGGEADLSNHITNDGTDHSLLTATPGTAEASKAVVLDSSKDVSGVNDLTADNEISAGVMFDLNGTNGVTVSITFTDAGMVTHSVEVEGGIITQWNTK